MTVTLLRSSSGLSVAGSLLNTSIPAIAILPEVNPSRRASSLYNPPLAQLIKMTPSFIFAISSLPIMPIVSAFLGV